MKILKRDKNNNKWKKVSKRGYKDEAELQDILYDDPSIIPIQSISEDYETIKVTVKEFGLPGSGRSDIVGIDENGNISIIETKLAANPEVKREVIGQILEYAAYLWKKTYEQFDEVIEKREEQPLLDLIEEKVEGDLSMEDFRRQVSYNLQNGEFLLFIVVDEIDDKLKRIIEFINSQSFSGPQIYAMSVGYFKEGDDEILVPDIYGTSIKETEARKNRNSTRKQWNKDKFFDQASKNLTKKQLETIKKIYNFSKENADDMGWGTGASRGSFSPKFEEVDNKSLYSVYSDGEICINTGWLNGNERIEKIRDYYKEKIDKIDGLKMPKNYKRGKVAFEINTWNPVIDELIKVFEDVLKKFN